MKRTIITIAILAISLHCISQKIDYELNKQGDKYVIEYKGESYYVDTSVFSVSSKYDISSDYIVLRKNILDVYDILAPINKTADEFVSMLTNDYRIERIYCNTIGSYNSITVNDGLIFYQWNLSRINVFNAWEITTGNPNIKVAIIDSGINWEHADMGTGADSYQNIYTNTLENDWNIGNDPTTGNNIDDDNNSYVDDYKGWNYYNNTNDSRPISIAPGTIHGTMVAGVIGAKSNNITGIAGIAGGNNNEGCKIIPYCVGDDVGPLSSVVDDAIVDAVNAGANVINLSFRVARNNAIDSALMYAYNNNVVVVAGSGNDTGSEVAYPSSFCTVLSVGAINEDNIRRFDSNYGFNLNLVAPGEDIYSTFTGNTYYRFSQTSSATPHVSGVAALMLSVNPNLTSAQVKTIIEQTAQRIRDVNEDPVNGLYNYTESSDHPNGPWNNEMGYGLVDAHAAVMEAYFYDRQILGSNIISPCSIAYPCNGIFTYDLNSSNMPSNTTMQWSVSGNLALVSPNNQSISVQPTGNGTGTITITYTHEGYTVTKHKDITIENMPPSSNYYCNYSTTGNMTFNNELYINGTFTINNGHVVTINGIGFCFPDAKIVVQPGGKLVVDDGKLTNYCSGKMWKGIRVLGNKNQQQLATNQGTVEIKNSSVISNAKNAISTWDGDDYNSTGGIVQCTNSTFSNNRRCAEFMAYTNHDANNQECNNVSYFKDCDFIINDANIFSSAGVTYSDMITMWGVNGIAIRGCHFSDNRTGLPTRGNAITLAGAGVNIKPSCAFNEYNINTPCTCLGESINTFYGFTKGVKAENTGTNYPFYVFKTNFSLCEQSVYSSAVNNYEVTMSNFNLTGVESLLTINSYGLYSSNSTGYKIEGNSVYTTNTTPVFCTTYGIYMAGSGTSANTIYRNTFNKLDYGIYTSNNPGLQVSCNELSNIFNTDIYVVSSFPFQGTSSSSAGNKFTSGATNINSGTSFWYFYSGTANTSNPYYPASTTSNVTKRTGTANNCTPTICTQTINPKSVSADDDIALYDTLQQMYESRLAEYNAAGYGFLLENFNENDAGIVAVAMQKHDTLISLSSTMAEIANRNMEAIFKDTVMFDREALNGWYNRINTTTAKYSLVNSYFEVGNYDLARQELALIPQRFALTTDELAEYDNFCQYNVLRESVYSSGRNYARLTEDEIAELQTIVERNTGVSSAYANSVLCFFYGICREDEKPETDDDAPINSKSTTAVAEESTETEPIAIYVYPNPAEDELNILLNTLPEGKTMIEFHDVTGRLVLSEEIRTNSTSINISPLKQGVYMYRIVNGDNVIARDRIVKE